MLAPSAHISPRSVSGPDQGSDKGLDPVPDCCSHFTLCDQQKTSTFSHHKTPYCQWTAYVCVCPASQGTQHPPIMTGDVCSAALFALLEAKACLAFTYTSVWLRCGRWYLSQPSAGSLEGEGGLTPCLYQCEGTDKMGGWGSGGAEERTGTRHRAELLHGFSKSYRTESSRPTSAEIWDAFFSRKFHTYGFTPCTHRAGTPSEHVHGFSLMR